MGNYFRDFAEMLEKDFGSFYDREESFVECPECGEPIYECDWEPYQYREMALDGHLIWRCPVCESVLAAEDEF